MREFKLKPRVSGKLSQISEKSRDRDDSSRGTIHVTLSRSVRAISGENPTVITPVAVASNRVKSISHLESFAASRIPQQ